MSPVFAARRRAEEFNSLIERASTRELHDTRTIELAELVGALRETAPVQARPAFVGDLRERLMAEAATALSPAAREADPRGDVERQLSLGPRRTARDRRIAVAVSGFAIVGATTSMAMAAQSALPGDTLYPLKRAIENVQTGFSVSDNQRASSLLANASGRLVEVHELGRAEELGDTDVAVATLAAFIEQASAGSVLLITEYQENGDADAIAELLDFTAASMEALADLQSLLPDGARAALIQAAQLLTQIDAEAAALCSICGGEGISVIPPFAIKPVDDVIGGLAGSLGQPLDVPAAHSGGSKDSGKGRGKGASTPKDTGQGTNGGKGQETSSASPQQPGQGAGSPSSSASGGHSSGNGGNGSEPSTVGQVVGGLLGGSGTTGGSGGTGTTTSTPPTLPEVIDDVVDGVGDSSDTGVSSDAEKK